MLGSVAVVILDSFPVFEMGVACEVFGVDRTDDHVPRYDFTVVAGEPGRLRSAAGFTVDVPGDLGRLDQADLIIVAAVANSRIARDQPDYPGPLLDALRRAADRGSRVLSICTGAFVLGAAGLLDGRSCTTHWMHADRLARLYPAAKVDPGVLYVDDDPVITSAGSAAGIDACLYLVRREQGSRVANAIARRMVVPPHRDGGQAQYVEQSLGGPAPDTLAEVLAWLGENLAEPVTVESLAARAYMSPRTFARRFVAETGTTPQRWVTGQRVLLAQQLLEESDQTVDEIAVTAGFGNAVTLRHHFRVWRSTTPLAYRRAFRDRSASPRA